MMIRFPGMPGRRTAAETPLFLVPLLALALSAPSLTGAADGLPKHGDDLFQPESVWTIHLRFTPEQWAAMEPKSGANPFDMSAFGNGMFLAPVVMKEGDGDKNERLSSDEFRALGERWFTAWDHDGDGVLDSKQLREGLKAIFPPPPEGGGDGGPPPGMSLQAKKGLRNGLSGLMGIDFAQVRADLDLNGERFNDVAVRYKGNGTFMEARATLKRSLKIDMNKFVKGQKLAGATTINLHNNVTDAGMMNEAIAFQLYREADVPAPRTSYARVFVTVPGRHENKYFGLYSIIENVDKNFAADRGFPKGGAIFKPSSPNLFDDLGDDWEAYEQTYDPKTDLTAKQKRRMIDFCRLVSKANDEEFASRLGDFIDLDEFARFLAVSVWIGDLDSLLTTGQNFYLYLDPKDDRFRFIPWDKDHTFGSWIAGTPADREQHSIHEPWEGRKRFLERAFKVQPLRDRYVTALTKFAEDHARPEWFEKRVAELAAAIRPAVKEEGGQKFDRFEKAVAGKPVPGGGFFAFGPPAHPLLLYVKNRAVSVNDQLAGKGPAPYVMGKPRAGGGEGGPKPPEFHPEEMLEAAFMKALDTDKSKTLGRDEFVEGFTKWFTTWDTAKAGSLAEDEVRKGLNKALPFAPPPPPPRQNGPKPDARPQS